MSFSPLLKYSFFTFVMNNHSKPLPNNKSKINFMLFIQYKQILLKIFFSQDYFF